jgi:hypothetical protein
MCLSLTLRKLVLISVSFGTHSKRYVRTTYLCSTMLVCNNDDDGGGGDDYDKDIEL